MKIICNLSDRQLQKVLILSGASDSEAEKVSKALPNYPELDITDFLEKNDSDKSAASLWLLLLSLPLPRLKTIKHPLNTV